MSVSVTVDDVWTKFVANRSPELRDELINTYAPLVRFVVARLGIPPTSMLEADDLVSYGMIGLINAIDRFDPARGVRFEAYATSRIRGAVIDSSRTQIQANNQPLFLGRSCFHSGRKLFGEACSLHCSGFSEEPRCSNGTTAGTGRGWYLQGRQ